ncbi:MAG TPA: ATP-binding protein [Verrucomicrobiae bacterium]|nr:ATP-binding protein [Verrucomicrobiae bacterium]
MARSGVFWKLGLTYFVLLIAVLAAVDFYAGRILRQNYIHAADERLNSLALIARSNPPKFDDETALASWAAGMSRSGARVTIIAANGRVLADSAHDIETMENHSNRPEFRQAMSSGEGESVRHSRTLDRDLVYWAVRFERPSGSPVVIRFATPLAEINSALAEVRRRLWEVSLVILLLAIGISVLFSRRFAKRVGELQEFSERVATGDFRPLIQESATDELGDLARALNDTASRLSATISSLSDERNRTAAILRSMAEGIAVINADEQITFYNEAFARLWNLDNRSHANRSAVSLIRHPDVLQLIRSALAGQEARGELSLGSAQPRHFSVTAATILASSDGSADSEKQSKPAGAVVVLHEITEIRRLEQVRKDFVANVSHELRTPLTAIQGFAETLLNGALDDPQNNRHFIEVIRNHASRLARLTEDLLELSKIEAGKLAMDLRSVAVADLIAPVIDLAQDLALRKPVSLNVINPAIQFPMVRGDVGLLREVLRNLLDNAIQYTPAGGRVEVSAERNGSSVVFTVADTGIGIPQAEHNRIFERFYRVDAARSREAGGTGLGLAIAKHIVEAHGGQIWLDSEIGRGSKFHFSIPLAG